MDQNLLKIEVNKTAKVLSLSVKVLKAFKDSSPIKVVFKLIKASKTGKVEFFIE